MLARMGSLNALEQDKHNSFWAKWLGSDLPSADTMGRVFTQIDLDSIRSLIHHIYSRLRRNKAIETTYGFHVLIIDGHESSASYLRCCSDCLRRRIRTRDEECIQYFHRNVVAMLLGEKFPVLLDVEEQKPGEDEVSCATRLINRIIKNYPRAFDVVVADGLYLRANFFELLLNHGKEIIAVLKDETRDLMIDAMGIFSHQPPKVKLMGNAKWAMWDVEEFTSWESFNRKVRVVRCEETKTIRRQRTGKKEQETSQWMWATTLSQREATTETIVNLGRSRWLIENKALNEMVTYWHADHVYRHHPTAITAFWLTLMLTINLFRAFVFLNIRACLRNRYSKLYFSKLISTELYKGALLKIPP